MGVGQMTDDAKNLLDTFTGKTERLRDMLEYKSRCPCCGELETCLDGCTFAEDCPEEHGQMMFARSVLMSAYKEKNDDC